MAKFWMARCPLPSSGLQTSDAQAKIVWRPESIWSVTLMKIDEERKGGKIRQKEESSNKNVRK